MKSHDVMEYEVDKSRVIMFDFNRIRCRSF